MKSIENRPRIRFKNFPGEWEEFKIGDLTQLTAGGTPSTTNPKFWGGDIPWMNSGELNLKKVSDVENRITKLGLSKSSTKLIPPQCILIGLAGQGKTRGTAAINLIELCTNQSIAAIYPNPEKFVSEFVYQNIDSRYEELRRLSTGEGGRGGLNLQILRAFSVFLPSLPEQQKIASFLSSVDERIELLEQKKEKLEVYKKGVMQQIFSQQIRFRQDDGSEFPDWEERKLGEVANIKRGASPRPISDPKWFSENSQIGWVRISDVTKSSKTLTQTDQYLSKEGVKKSRPVKRGSIIMSICATIGKPIFTGFDVCIHDGFVVFEAPEVSEEFLFYLLQQIEPSWKKYGQPGIQLNLNTDIVSNEVIEIPSAKEQVKICAFLKALDDKITQTDQTLEKTRLWKKGLLQQMFV